MNTTADLERGQAAYSSSRWQDAYASLSAAERVVPLAAEDLELLATSAYMLGREEDWMDVLGRAFQRHSDNRAMLRAARCAFWIGMQLALRGEMGPAIGWLGRAQRLVEREDRECAEQGYMLLPVAFEHEVAGDFDGAAATAGAAAEIGELFFRRRRSLRACGARPGWPPRQVRSCRGRARVARRGDGDGDGGRAFPDRDG